MTANAPCERVAASGSPPRAEYNFHTLCDDVHKYPELLEFDLNLRSLHDAVQIVKAMDPDAAVAVRYQHCTECGGELTQYAEGDSCERCGLVQQGSNINEDNPYRSFNDSTVRDHWCPVSSDTWRTELRHPQCLKPVQLQVDAHRFEDRANRRDDALYELRSRMHATNDDVCRAKILYVRFSAIKEIACCFTLALACMMVACDHTSRRTVPSFVGWTCPTCNLRGTGVAGRAAHVRTCTGDALVCVSQRKKQRRG